MWYLIVQGAAAAYLVGGSLAINVAPNLPSRIYFRVIPMAIGLPLAFGVAAQLLGWPV